MSGLNTTRLGMTRTRLKPVTIPVPTIHWTVMSPDESDSEDLLAVDNPFNIGVDKAETERNRIFMPSYLPASAATTSNLYSQCHPYPTPCHPGGPGCPTWYLPMSSDKFNVRLHGVEELILVKLAKIRLA